MRKRFWIQVLVLFVLAMALDALLHGVLLKGRYDALGGLYRPDADQQRHLPWMLLAHLVYAFAFVWIYRHGHEERPWLTQGLRYGFAVALIAQIPTYLIYYAVQPLPGDLVAQQSFLGTAAVLLEGGVGAGMTR